MFGTDLVRRAIAEWEFFGKDEGSGDHKAKSKQKETVEPYSSRIGDYWMSISDSDYDSLVNGFAGGKGKLDGTITALPWSAAFISYCMQVAGAGAEFPYAPGHATWIVLAIRNKQKDNLDAPLVGYEPGDLPVALGDLVGVSRQKGVTYANAVEKGWFTAHTDIVVEVDTAGGKFYTIGGNVGQSVSRKTFPLDEDGGIAHNAGLMVHIKNSITGKLDTSAFTHKVVAFG